MTDMVEDVMTDMVEGVGVEESNNVGPRNIAIHTDVAPMAATNVKPQGEITVLKKISTTGWVEVPEVAFGSNDGQGVQVVITITIHVIQHLIAQYIV